MQKPLATVCAIITKERKVLLTKRKIEPFKGYWCLPGGHIEYGETAKDAIIREVEEEVDLHFKPIFIGYYDEIIPGIGWHRVVLIFSGKTTGVPKPGKEVSEIKWFSFNELNSLQLAFKHKEILLLFLNKKKNND